MGDGVCVCWIACVIMCPLFCADKGSAKIQAQQHQPSLCAHQHWQSTWTAWNLAFHRFILGCPHLLQIVLQSPWITISDTNIKHFQTFSNYFSHLFSSFLIIFHPFSDSAPPKASQTFSNQPQCSHQCKRLLPIQFPGASPNDLCLLEKGRIHARSAASQVKCELPQSRPHVAPRPAGNHWQQQ